MRFSVMGMVGDVPFEEAVVRIVSQGFEVVLMDPGYVAGAGHLVSAVEHAERAMANGTARSKTIQTEVILYAAWERQIGRANDRMRPKDAAHGYAAVIIGEGDFDPASIGMSRDDSILDPTPEKAVSMGLCDPFLSPEDQAIENVAMVDLLKQRSKDLGCQAFFTNLLSLLVFIRDDWSEPYIHLRFQIPLQGAAYRP